MLSSKFLTALATGLAISIAAGTAHATPADDARAHFQAAAAGDAPALMRGYAEQAHFQWAGGPLDGAYSGTEAIQALWTKFAAAQGPLQLTVGDIDESANPKGATVSAPVLFKGKNPIKVRYVLTYRDGKIVNEVWQIDPQLTLAGTR